jgi:hypothetical protein
MGGVFSRKRHWISWTRFRPDPTRPDLDLGAQLSYPMFLSRDPTPSDPTPYWRVETRRVGRFSYRIPIHAVFSKPPVTQSSIGKMPPCAIGPKHRRVWRYMSVIMKPHCVVDYQRACSLLIYKLT